MKALFAAVTAGLLAALVNVAPAWATGEFNSGNWKGWAVFDNGRFSICRMQVGYSSGYELRFGIDRNEAVFFVIAKNVWNLTVGTKYEVGFQIDGGRTAYREGSAVDRNGVLITMTNSNDTFQQLRYGRSLRVTVGDQTSSFTLDGTQEALVELLRCKRKYS